MHMLNTNIINGFACVDAQSSYASKTTKERSDYQLPKVISMFSGAGGLDLGFHQEGFEIPLAMDILPAAIKTHRRNFPQTHSVAADLLEIGPEGVLKQVRNLVQPGEKIGIIGGPPCQGFSRANINSNSKDPRNRLTFLYLKIIKELQKEYSVEFVVFENVLGLLDKKHASKYKSLVRGLKNLDFQVTEKVLSAVDFGVAQTRRRVILSAMKQGNGYSEVIPQKRKGASTVQEVIGNLEEPAFFSRSLDVKDIPLHPNHWTMNPKSPRFQNPDKEYPKGRSFKRLDWNKASPTIAFGNREIHVHPDGRRRLSIYEAMLLQGFPKSFVLDGTLSEQVEQISNAVPPPLAKSVAAAVKQSMSEV
ncbi:MAG: DNA cytosine methyltransferase [Alphaproteobacteria bacterium]|nr:DNA cytosine methyltransferase [Alphaproteobacteria bacterium]